MLCFKPHSLFVAADTAGLSVSHQMLNNLFEQKAEISSDVMTSLERVS